MFQKFLRAPTFLTLCNEFYINHAFKQMEEKVNISLILALLSPSTSVPSCRHHNTIVLILGDL